MDTSLWLVSASLERLLPKMDTFTMGAGMIIDTSPEMRALTFEKRWENFEMAQTARQIVRKFQPAKPKNLDYGMLGTAPDGGKIAYYTYQNLMSGKYGVRFYHENYGFIHQWIFHGLEYKALSGVVERQRPLVNTFDGDDTPRFGFIN